MVQWDTEKVFNNSYPGVAKSAFSEATAISQLATSWQPAAVAKPTKQKAEFYHV